MHISHLQIIHVTVATLCQLFAYPFTCITFFFYNSLTHCYPALLCSHLVSYSFIPYVYQNSKLEY